MLRASQSQEWPRPYIAIRCPSCQRDHLVKHGTTRRGPQRSLCQNTACARGSFLRNDRNRGCVPAVKQQMIAMSLNASGIRDTARVLHISTNTVLRALRKQATALDSGNTAL